MERNFDSVSVSWVDTKTGETLGYFDTLTIDDLKVETKTTGGWIPSIQSFNTSFDATFKTNIVGTLSLMVGFNLYTVKDRREFYDLCSKYYRCKNNRKSKRIEHRIKRMIFG